MFRRKQKRHLLWQRRGGHLFIRLFIINFRSEITEFDSLSSVSKPQFCLPLQYPRLKEMKVFQWNEIKLIPQGVQGIATINPSFRVKESLQKDLSVKCIYNLWLWNYSLHKWLSCWWKMQKQRFLMWCLTGGLCWLGFVTVQELWLSNQPLPWSWEITNSQITELKSTVQKRKAEVLSGHYNMCVCLCKRVMVQVPCGVQRKPSHLHSFILQMLLSKLT